MFLPYYCNTPKKLNYYPEDNQKHNYDNMIRPRGKEASKTFNNSNKKNKNERSKPRDKKPCPDQKDYDNTMICMYFQAIDYDEDNINAFDEHLFSEMRDNFSTEDIHDNFQQCFLFQPEENSINVDDDMDTSSFIDLDEHVDSLAFDMDTSSSPMTKDL